MLATRAVDIDRNETSQQLTLRLSALGATLVREEIPRYLQGALAPIAQDPAHATMAPMLSREMSRIEWKKTARQVHDQVRGLQPWPGADTTLGARRLMVHNTTMEGAPMLQAGAPGEVVAVTKDRVWVATAQGALAITEVQREGKKRVAVRDFLAGHPLRVGTFFGAQ
jgi:methionyl-tRNA formyltransferase